MKHFELHYYATLLTGTTVGTSAFLPGVMVDKVTARAPVYRREHPGLQDAPPMIPATHIKGKARHGCEAILSGLRIPCCHAPAPEAMCPQLTGMVDLAGQQTHYCLSCQIFGSPWQQADVMFSDLRLETGLEQLERGAMELLEGGAYTRIQPGVGLHRDRGIARKNILRYMERIREGRVFTGTIEGTLPAPLIGLLWASLRDLPALGGSRSRGAGKARITLESLTLGWPDSHEATYTMDTMPDFLREELNKLPIPGRKAGGVS